MDEGSTTLNVKKDCDLSVLQSYYMKLTCEGVHTIRDQEGIWKA